MRHSCLSIAVLALMGTTACFAADPPTSTRPARELYLSLAAEVEQCLQKDVLDKWFPAAVDEQGGGFHENFSADWSRAPGETRSLVYQSRLTWTAAKAAERFPERAQLYLAMTRRGAAFLADRLWDKQRGGFYWSVDAAGRPTGQGETRKHTYGMAFGIYALAASYRATRDPATQDLARQAFEWLERHVHDDVNKGYFESVTLDGKPHFGRNPIAGENQKSMNTSIHVLEALTELYKAWTDPAVRVRIQEMYDICADRIYTEPGYLTMFFTPDWQRIAGEDSFGHDVETAYLLVEASELLGQSQHTRAWGLARNLVDHALRYGWDEQRGGLYDAAHIDAQGVVRGGLRTDKIWWVQAEHLNALLMLHDRFGNETTRYWDAFVKQWDFIRKHQIDHINGGWHPTVRADGTPLGGPKSGPWTECYHQARALLNVSERLRRLAQTGPGAPHRLPPRPWINTHPEVPYLPKPPVRPADWIVEHPPVTPNASPEARALLKFLYSISGKYTLTGQHNYPNTQRVYTEIAAGAMGKTPALYGTDWGFGAEGTQDSIHARPQIVQELIRQHRKGSIIAICWHAVRPTEDEPVTFRSSVQGKLTRVQFEELVTPGSPLNRRWLAQVDVVAEYLKQLQAARVPILWRPFHEINGDWFWWNGWRGPRGSAQLYRLLFDRLVNHHKIDNLIWVWNPDRPEREDKQFVDYFPGHEYVDVLSLDTYGGYNQSYYDDLNALSGGKPMGISECGANLPPLDLYATQPKWAFYMVWPRMGPAAVPTAAAPATRPRGDAVDYREMARHPRLLSLEDAAYQEAIAPLRALSGGGRAE